LFLLLLGGALLIVFGVLNEPIMWNIIVIGAVCVVLGVLSLTVVKFRKLIAEVSEEGIVERVSKVSNGLIRWEEIALITVVDSGMSNSLGRREDLSWENENTDAFVSIFLKDTDAYAKRLNVLQRSIMKLCLNHGQAPINIPCNLLNENTEEFVALCNRLGKKAHTTSL